MEWKNQKGISLVEVMVATGILLLAMIFISNVIISGIKSAKLNKERLEMVSVTTSVIEEIKGNKNIWQEREGKLGGWLKSQGWNEGEEQFTKDIDIDNTKYKITLEVKEIKEGLLQIKVTTESSGLTPMVIITKTRGD
ncbi:type IV pilus modification PilV family protein [Anaerobranca gottschalkii]|uniref:Type IV pilin N-term methylation site GFxxxE n=1 Tax=Anaerobranca gottschalkii DSM 13577 TaxID=1120990 RepID=A0A1I0B214_9FIRM|nr:prepilin-type N-terminal cleavage/methylation domain-containing protein [Anaerobranca gottschalkii]SET00779.1 Type IV pilin N-term methylation site GFxxxE [Anaerobranca gottschalkii DSM 13577]